MSHPTKPAVVPVRQRPLDEDARAWLRFLAEEALRMLKAERAEDERKERAA